MNHSPCSWFVISFENGWCSFVVTATFLWYAVGVVVVVLVIQRLWFTDVHSVMNRKVEMLKSFLKSREIRFFGSSRKNRIYYFVRFVVISFSVAGGERLSICPWLKYLFIHINYFERLGTWCHPKTCCKLFVIHMQHCIIMFYYEM